MRPESASAMSRRVYSFYRAVTATYIISTLVVMAFYHSARWNSGGSDSQQPPIKCSRPQKKLLHHQAFVVLKSGVWRGINWNSTNSAN